MCVFRQQHSHQGLPAEWHHPLSWGAAQLLPICGIHDDPRMRTGRRLDGVSQDFVHQQPAGIWETRYVQTPWGKHLTRPFKQSLGLNEVNSWQLHLSFSNELHVEGMDEFFFFSFSFIPCYLNNFQTNKSFCSIHPVSYNCSYTFSSSLSFSLSWMQLFSNVDSGRGSPWSTSSGRRNL